MERKLGEIFEYKGEWYQCIPHTGCELCDFNKDDGCEMRGEDMYCSSNGRRDETPVIFKKLEKVGEPIEYDGEIYQGFKAFDNTITEVCNSCAFNDISCGDAVECDTGVFFKRIKQNQEDMEEKKQKWGVSSDTINEINKGIEPMNTSRNIDTERSGDEGIRRNLKPFNLEASKAGKPVCTRDGRKARIICFDAKFPKTGNIVALVEKENGEETTLYYYDDGHCSIGNGYDLMMLPEKHEGWVNVYKVVNGHESGKIFATEEEAKTKANDGRVATIKIEWED